MKKWIFVILGLVVVSGVVAFSLNRDHDNFEIIPSTVESGPITMTVETLGTVEPMSTVQIGCEATGKIIEMAVDHDDPVKKDQVICRIDPETADAQHAQSIAELSRAKSLLADAKVSRDQQLANLPSNTAQVAAQLKSAEGDLVQAEYYWKRTDEFYKNGNAAEAEWVTSKAQNERATAAVDNLRAAYELAKNNEKYLPQRLQEGVDQAEAAQKLAQARFEFTEAQVKRCVITSPIDGIVLKRYMDVGATVNAAFTTPPLFLLAPSLERLRVNARVSESDISRIDVGQKARFTVEGKQRSNFEGKIEHKRNQPDVIQNVVTYTVILEVNNDDRHTLLPGMTVNIEIECIHKNKTPKISNASLRFKPPITLEERREIIERLEWPPQPKTDAEGREALYCEKGNAWRFDPVKHQWLAVPLWLGITDNVDSEVLWGAQSGDAFVKKFIDKSSSGFSLKEAMNLANPNNRTI